MEMFIAGIKGSDTVITRQDTSTVFSEELIDVTKWECVKVEIATRNSIEHD